MDEWQKNVIAKCGEECEACLKIAARCAAQGDDASAAKFRGFAAAWSARAFEEVAK